jgi:MFS family permease
MARDLRLFYLFRLLATSYLWVPVAYHFVIARGLGYGDFMVLGAIYSGVVILVEVPTGALADRIGRRQSMMAGALAMVASCVLAYFAHDFSTFVLVYVLAAISMSLCSGADSAYLFDLLHENGRSHEYPRREGTASAWHLAGSAAAFAAGGVLGQINLALPYLCTAGVAAAAFVVAVCMRSERRPEASPRPQQSPLVEISEYMRHMGASLREVASSRALGWIMAYSAVVFVLLRATEYLYQPYLEGRGFSIAETGFVFAGVCLVGSFVAHRGDALRQYFGETRLLWGLLGILAVSYLLLNHFSGQWALSMLAMQAVASGLYSPLVKPILNRQISDSDRRATVLSIESIARRSAIMVFLPVAGFYGQTSAIYLCGGLALVGMALLWATSHHCPARGPGALPARACEDEPPVRATPRASTLD